MVCFYHDFTNYLVLFKPCISQCTGFITETLMLISPKLTLSSVYTLVLLGLRMLSSLGSWLRQSVGWVSVTVASLHLKNTLNS